MVAPYLLFSLCYEQVEVSDFLARVYYEYMKKYLYYACFTILGLLCALLVHALLEIAVLHTITHDLARYGENFIWQNWYEVHAVASFVLWLVGFSGGLWGGRYFWHILYIEKRYGTPRL
jgi:hypothetical protein